MCSLLSNGGRPETTERIVQLIRRRAESVGLVVKSTEEAGINDLVQSLFNQYEVAFDKSNFVKFYENVYGVNWGTSLQIVQQGRAPPPSK